MDIWEKSKKQNTEFFHSSDAPPIHSTPYHAGSKHCRLEQEEGAQTKEDVAAEAAVTEWALLIVIVLQNDGNSCLCVDYRRLNAVTLRDSYPIPRTDECIDSLGEEKVFATTDANLDPVS